MAPTTEAERMALRELERAILEPRVWTIREIAQRLGTSHGNVANIEKRALEKLRKRALKGAET